MGLLLLHEGKVENPIGKETEAGVLNIHPHKYKTERMDAKAGGSLLPATKTAVEKFVTSAFIRQTAGLNSCKTTVVWAYCLFLTILSLNSF